ncbi:hypothetical protein PROFUN_08964 [Planoprotostelium fungivorum]|uniref:Uncharacterized protein n=1 Tax=Planoprotostelium fungivorum TaxID=1890364 RepID=A0A2P6NIH6_9EUKA|nr:hypothetical protein PROFUN_08964 [Planoprotostelium fungivorum]
MQSPFCNHAQYLDAIHYYRRHRIEEQLLRRIYKGHTLTPDHHETTKPTSQPQMSKEEIPLLEKNDVEREEEFGWIYSRTELTDARLWRATLAELMGTFLLVVVSIISNLLHHDDIMTRAAMMGLINICVVFTFEEISGAQLSPPVSWGTFLAGKQSLLRAVVFTLTQMLAAVLAVPAVMALVTPDLRHDDEYKLGATMLQGISPARGLLVESAITFFFIFVDFSLTLNPVQPIIVTKLAAPFVISSVMSINTFYALNLTGACSNPARSFGSAVWSGYWKDHWVYWLAGFMGSSVATLLFRVFVHGNDNKTRLVYNDWDSCLELALNYPDEPVYIFPERTITRATMALNQYDFKLLSYEPHHVLSLWREIRHLGPEQLKTVPVAVEPPLTDVMFQPTWANTPQHFRQGNNYWWSPPFGPRSYLVVPRDFQELPFSKNFYITITDDGTQRMKITSHKAGEASWYKSYKKTEQPTEDVGPIVEQLLAPSTDSPNTVPDGASNFEWPQNTMRDQPLATPDYETCLSSLSQRGYGLKILTGDQYITCRLISHPLERMKSLYRVTVHDPPLTLSHQVWVQEGERHRQLASADLHGSIDYVHHPSVEHNVWFTVIDGPQIHVCPLPQVMSSIHDVEHNESCDIDVESDKKRPRDQSNSFFSSSIVSMGLLHTEPNNEGCAPQEEREEETIEEQREEEEKKEEKKEEEEEEEKREEEKEKEEEREEEELREEKREEEEEEEQREEKEEELREEKEEVQEGKEKEAEDDKQEEGTEKDTHEEKDGQNTATTLRLTIDRQMKPIVLAVDPHSIFEDADDTSRERFILYTQSLLHINGRRDFLLRRTFGEWRKAQKLNVKLYLPVVYWRHLVEDPTLDADIDREIETERLSPKDIRHAASEMERETYGWVDDKCKLTRESPFFSYKEVWTSSREKSPIFLLRRAKDVGAADLAEELYRLWSTVLQEKENLSPEPKGFGTVLCGRRREETDTFDIIVGLEIDYSDYHSMFDLPPRSRYTERDRRSSKSHELVMPRQIQTVNTLAETPLSPYWCHIAVNI